MKKLYVAGVSALVLAVSLFSSLAVSKTFNTYKEWKTIMVGEAEKRVQKTKISMEIDPNLKNQLSKDQLQATIANELTISDYFVGYLNKQNNLQEAIKFVATKFSGDEIAELMSAYAYNFSREKLQPLKSAADVDSKILFE